MSLKSNFTIPAVAAISFCLIGGTVPAYADLGDQLAKLLPKDGAAFDYFGWSVAISGTTAIVAAPGDDDDGSGSGSAYLFDTTSGKQLFKLLPNDGAESEAFGYSVAISGDTAIVGAKNDDDNGSFSGSAYLFDINTGKQLFKLLPNDGAVLDYFGYSVAISGTIVVVGAFGDDDNGESSGSAYLFDATTGQQITKLLAKDGAAGDSFGLSVAISGTIAVVGAFVDDNGSNSGSAYLFDTTTGEQLFKLLPNDGAVSDYFGWSVAISGATVIVGAYGDDDNGSNSGSAYFFDTTTGKQFFKLLPEDGAETEAFGWSVAISGDTAIVAAVGDDDNGSSSGSAYFFDITSGKQLFKLLPNDGAESEAFGYSVAISGGAAIVGAKNDDDNGHHSGSAYLFDTTTCLGDLNDDGSVGATDLLILLAFWGRCTPVCLGDFDGDGNVGASDLLTLLANWGPCP